MTQGDLGNCYIVAVLDQLLTSADFIVEDRWDVFSPCKNTARCYINTNGITSNITVDFYVPYG